MGCSTSTQTSAVDMSRPSAKPEEMNGATVTGELQNLTLITSDKQMTAMSPNYVELFEIGAYIDRNYILNVPI